MSAFAKFLAQPFGVAGAICIMLAVTAFNSRRLTQRFRRAGSMMPLLLNSLNLIGGICLYINASIRDEIVWKVLEVYFVLIAIKGIAQSLRQKPSSGPDSPA